MRTVQIISHCFSERHDCYAKMLTAQLSSIVLHPPKNCRVLVTVPAARTDDLTLDTVLHFVRKIPDPHRIRYWIMEPERLFRRGIGRDEIAREAAVASDIVWWADCDLLFGHGCLDALAASDFTGLAFPRTQLVHRAHWIGDRDLTQIVPGQLWEPNPADFEPNKIKFASGGFIIVDGATARKGFMHGTRWTEPVDPKGGFRDPREDISYRKSFNGQSTVLGLPNLFRFRHSATPFEKPEDRLKQTAHVK